MESSIIEDPVCVDAEERLSKALGQLTRKKDDYFFVTKKGRYAGVVDSRILRDNNSDPAQTKAKTVMKSAPTLRLDSPDEVVVGKLLTSRTKALAVLDKNDKVIGAVTRSKALHLLRGSPLVHGKKVQDVMSAPAITLSDTASIGQARALMKQKSIFRLVVTDKSGAVAGVLSAFDLATKVQPSLKERRRQYYYFPTPKLSMEEEPVRLAMTENPATIKANDSALEAIRLLEQKGVSGLVVVDGKMPKGVITTRDLFGLVVAPKGANVKIMGLTGEEHIFKNSLQDMVSRYWEKISQRVRLQPDDELIVDVRSKNKSGNKREYEVKSRITVKGRVLAHRPKDRPDHFKNWDLQAAVKESLEDLVKMVRNIRFSKHKDAPDTEE